MAEPRRFNFDSNQRSVGVRVRRRATWPWIVLSLALHGALVLFALVGAARGGHTELLGTLEVTVVGAPSAGEPEGSKQAEKSDTPPEPETPRRPEVREPTPPQQTLPQPAQTPPPPTAQSITAPDAPKPTPPPQMAEAPDPIALPRKVTQAEATPSGPSKETSERTPKRPDAVRAPEPPTKPREPTTAEPAPREPKPDKADATAKPTQTAAVPPPPTLARPKTARDAASPKAAPSAAPRGVKNAPQGQTAALGAPTGGDRLGRSDTDDTAGLLNINLNPRFRSPPPPPVYPRQSIERDEEGVVLVRALVDPAGAPQRVVVFKSSGFPMLDEAALAAVQKWRFEPMIRDGRASASWVQVPVRFRLN
jgi:periplasmic protein TonB